MEPTFELPNRNGEEMTILELQDAMVRGELTARELVMYYMYRIAIYDQRGPILNSIIEINPDAIFIAEALDKERKSMGPRSHLHGIPVLLKANIETNDKMSTSAGALVIENYISKNDAFLVQRLREAGAIILGKTNMTEWANGMSSQMWAGYSAKGGQVAHPYGDFFVGGSSTGSAVAVTANFTSVAVGTETSGSILSPSIQHSVVGIKPTVGLISRSGVIPFSYSQDTPGPMARTVEDAAILLQILTRRDEQDPATWRNEKSDIDYTEYLDAKGLEGARIGVVRNVPLGRFRDPDEYDEELYNGAIGDVGNAGAVIVDDIGIPSFYRTWEWDKLCCELKHGMDNFLQGLLAHCPVHSLSELIKWNQDHAAVALRYGQDKLERYQQIESPLKNPQYLLQSLTDLYYAQNEGIDYALKTYDLDAILFPSYVGADLSARAGYPTIAVPAGFKANGRPFGITFAGTAFSEPTLIRLAYAYEQRTKHRKKPVL
ncbi:amidase family protein [Paenibacillus sp. 1001270B_150601_E10]|uniref:amidase family protein n=1 Tax=Paenibacillus sp. 1001270B_150601_E10 TaxID=2787079 RepID=UPI00189D255A|nr:amidase family protein [Paenibacillus sp. 1001270B_150601_E10]